MPDLSLIVAHITDTHFGHDAGRAVDRTRRVLDELMRMDPRPDVLVHSGDVTDHGHPAEYDEAVKELAAWDGPMVISPGNHDVRVPFVDAFCDGPSARATCARTVNGVRFLMLDSLIDEVDGGRQDAGLLGSDQLAWLDEQLTADVSPTFVGLHHPPVELGISLMDPIMLGDAADLAAVIERHPHVRADPVRSRAHDGHEHLRRPAAARRRWRGLHRDARPGGPADRLVRRPRRATRSTSCTPTGGSPPTGGR